MTASEKSSGLTGSAAFFALVALLLIGILLASACLGNLMNGGSVISPRIVPVTGAAPPPQPSYTFAFGDATVSLTMAVDGAVYAGAKAADKEVTIYGNVSESDWITDSYRSMIDDPNQEAFYTGLLAQIRQVRESKRLSDDESADLMAVFVQSIPYETTAENPAKFPIETFTDKSGDCDDKSLLLAALLSREGYRTALFSFPNESHMAVGIACEGTDYRNTGFAYIETTNLSYIGVPPDGLGGDVVLSSDPIVIPVGSGNKTYDSCDETAYLHARYLDTKTRFSTLSLQAEAMRAEIKSLTGTKNIQRYNQRVAAYNNLIVQMNRIAEVHNYIANHQYDRKGTYEWVSMQP